MNTPPFLVTGASGQLGRLVLGELLVAPAGHLLIAATRTPQALADLASRGVEVRRADFDDPAEDLAASFRSAARALLISSAAAHAGERRRRQHRQAVAGLRQAGVRHAVYTSFTGATDPRLARFNADHAETEAALQATLPGTTVLRNAFYADLVLARLPAALRSGTWYSAAGTGRVPYVRREDCARAAAAALQDGFDGWRVLDITGPQALSAREVAGLAGEVLGRPMRVQEVDAEALPAALVAHGVPAPVAQVLAAIDRHTAAGAFEVETQDLAALTGRAGEPLATFLEAHRG